MQLVLDTFNEKLKYKMMAFYSRYIFERHTDFTSLPTGHVLKSSFVLPLSRTCSPLLSEFQAGTVLSPVSFTAIERFCAVNSFLVALNAVPACSVLESKSIWSVMFVPHHAVMLLYNKNT